MNPWDWDTRDPRAVERLWRFVDPDATGAFAFPSDGPVDAERRLVDMLGALRDRRIAYRYDLPLAVQRTNLESGSAGFVQRVRHPLDIYVTNEATCLDVALLAAGACLRAGLPCWVMIGIGGPDLDDHAWLVVDTAHPLRVEERGPEHAEFSTWEGHVLELIAEQAGPLDGDASALAGAVSDATSGLFAVDVSLLCEGAAGGTDRPTVEMAITAGADCCAGAYSRFSACDVGWWWNGRHVLPPPDGRSSPESARSLVGSLWKQQPAVPIAALNAPGAVSLAQLLRADRRVVDFVPSDESGSLRRLAVRWLERCRADADRGDAAPIGLLVLLGAGGAGKTRTASELLDGLAERGAGWRPALVGHLPRDAGRTAIATIAGLAGTVCLVLDYGEAYPDDVIDELGRQLGARRAELGPVLLVATGRERGEWVDQLGAQFPLIGVHAAPPLIEQRTRLARTVVERLAPHLSLHVDAEAVVTATAQVTDAAADDASPLEVILAGALALLGDVRPRAGDDLFEAALRHEANYWKHVWCRTTTRAWTSVIATSVRAAVAWTSIVRPTGRELADFLGIGGVSPRTAEIIVEVVDALYRDGGARASVLSSRLRGLEPDPLADHLIRDACADDSFRSAVMVSLGGLTPQRCYEALAVVDRAFQGVGSDDSSLVGLRRALSREIATAGLWNAAFAAASAGRGLVRDAAFDAASEFATDELVEAILRTDLPPGLAHLAVMAREKRVAAWRNAVAADPSLAPALATELVNHGIALARDGRHAAAVPPMLESAGLLRPLATADLSVRDLLATTLTNLSELLSRVGRLDEALAAGSEAIELERFLRQQPGHSEDGLATALHNHGAHLSAVGRVDEGVEVATEAVAIRRSLLASGAGDDAELSSALGALATRLESAGRFDESLDVTLEVVQSYRGLASGDSALLPDLATHLNNLSARLDRAGRHDEALAAATESAQIRRPLVATSDAYFGDLASALTNRSSILASIGRRSDATEAAQEAVALWRRRSEINPTHRHGLAVGLIGLGSRLAAEGRWPEALSTSSEAVDEWRALAAANPVFNPNLAHALRDWGKSLQQVGRTAEGAAACAEAVDLGRQHAVTTPSGVPDLAKSLVLSSYFCSLDGRFEDARAAASEAVELLRPVVPDDPRVDVDLVTALCNVAGSLARLGRHQEAVVACEEAVGWARTLVESDPAATPLLAGALTSLRSELSLVGRAEDAIATATEVVELYRTLSTDEPPRVPDLADALRGLGNLLSDAGRWNEGVQAATEAVGLYLGLEPTEALVPAFAGALGGLAEALIRAGRAGEGLAAAERSLELWVGLARKDERYRTEVAASLRRLSRLVAATGRFDDAINVGFNEVVVRRELASVDDQATGLLASALDQLGNFLVTAGRLDEAIEVGTEAVEIARGVPVHLDGLGVLGAALSNLGASLTRAERFADAVLVGSEAVETFRRLGAGGIRELPAALHNLGTYQLGMQRWDEAIDAASESVQLYQAVATVSSVPDLAKALTGLGSALVAAGDPDGWSLAWQRAIDAASGPAAVVWLRAHRAKEAAERGDPALATSDLVAVAEAEVAADDLGAYGAARRLAATVAQTWELTDAHPWYEPVSPTCEEALRRWVAAYQTAEEADIAREALAALGPDDLLADARRWWFLHPEVDHAERPIEVLEYVVEHGPEPVLAELQEGNLLIDALRLALAAAGASPIDAERLRTVFDDDLLASDFALGQLETVEGRAGEVCLTLAHGRRADRQVAMRLIDLLDDDRDTLRQRGLDALDRADLADLWGIAMMRPDVWNEDEEPIVLWTMAMMSPETRVAFEDDPDFDDEPPAIDLATLGVGLREVLIGLADRIPELRGLGIALDPVDRTR